jgi:hypothetical protein
LAVVMAAALLAPAFLAAQATSGAKTADKTAAAKPADKKPWTLPRTPDGRPDLQGYWTALSFTPMERHAKYGTREFLTDEEVKKIYEDGIQHSYEYTFANSSQEPVYDANVYGLAAWQNGVKPNRRTSFVVDPPDGRIPPLTPGGKKAQMEAKGQFFTRDDEGGAVVHADGPEDLNLGVRCLAFGGPPTQGGNDYDQTTHIVQSADYVFVEWERGSEGRIIPIDGGPHVSSNIHSWHGDSRGHWEGDTLVVETTNFRPGATYRNANPKTLKISERYTRVDAGTIEYKFTIDDPTTWTKPWSAIVPLSAVDGPMFEYACSEGNNGLINVLEGVRVKERAERDKAKATGTPISQK